MAGQYPGNAFGPPRQPLPPGPLGVAGKVLCCVLPVLTAGLLGFVPALVLAIRRKRRSDVAALVFFMALLGLMLVCAVIGGQDKRQVLANGLGITAMLLLALATPVHFLLMDRRAVWERREAPARPYPQPYPNHLYGTQQPNPQQPHLQQPNPQQPHLQQSNPQPPADDLQELGELLRRQAGGQAGGERR